MAQIMLIQHARATAIPLYISEKETKHMANKTDEGFFTDGEDLSEFLTDMRRQDTLTVSDKSEGIELIEEFRSSEVTSLWSSLDRSEVADRLWYQRCPHRSLGHLRPNE